MEEAIKHLCDENVYREVTKNTLTDMINEIKWVSKGMLSKREINRKIINYPYVTFFGHMRYQVGRSWQITEEQLKGY